MKQHIKTLPVIVFLLIFSACSEDFLDFKNPNAITSETFFETTDDFKLAVNALYSRLGGLIDVFSTNSRTGDSKITDGAYNNQVNYSSFLNDATSGDSDGLYDGCYGLIYAANQIIYRIDNIEWTGDNAALKTAITAEAHFFRGLAYFHLAAYFGQVPIVTKPALTQDDYHPKKAGSIGEVYDQAIADLKIAKDGLPQVQEVAGKVIKTTATAYLGKACLYRASYLKEDSYYALAATEFDEVIKSGNHSLVANFQDNFTSKNENNPESLLEVQFKFSAAIGTPEQSRQLNSVPGIGNEIFLRPSDWLLQTMQKEKDLNNSIDIRCLETAYFNNGLPLLVVAYNQLGEGLYYAEGKVQGKSPDGDGTTDGAWWRKYLNVHLNAEPLIVSGQGGDNNERLMRYADVLLMYAEAQVMATKTMDANAIDAVKQVRDRANLAVKTYTSTDDLMEEIRHQRFMEFAYEGILYFDLIRWELLAAYIQDHGTDAQKANYNPVKHKYFPLPVGEVLNNKNLDQNEAWK